MNRETWKIRHYKPGEEKEIINLLKKGSYAPKSKKWWQWKYQKNPAGESIILVAEVGNMIVGSYALIPWRLKLENQNVIAYQALDAVTHPSYQKQGIFTALVKASLREAEARGIPFVFCFPNKASLPGHLKVGWRIVANPRLLLKIINPLSIISRKLGLRRTDNRFTFPPEASHKVENKVGFKLFSNVNKLWQEVRRTKPLMTVRDSSFLKWRYEENPETTYYKIFYQERGKLKGFIVFRFKIIRGLQMGIIVDFIVPSGRYDIAKHLLKNAELKMKNVGIDCILTTISKGTVQFASLIRRGFFYLPKKSTFALFPFGQSRAQHLLNIDNWFLTYGDGDFI